jgi:hypothetical protein
MAATKKKPVTKKKSGKTSKKVSQNRDFTAYGIITFSLLSVIFLIVIVVKFL